MKNYIEDRVIIVTGAGSGFGKLISEMAAQKGGKVICSGISEENLKSVVDGIKSKGENAEYIVADVRSKEQMDRMAEFAVDTYGQIDVMVNNAGTMPLAFFGDHEKAAKAWETCIDVNFKGVLNGITAVYDQMMKQERGHIINISSIYGNAPNPGAGVYTATKVAVRYMTEALRQETQGMIKTTLVRPTGIGGTNLSNSIINPQAMIGIIQHNMERSAQHVQQAMSDNPGELVDINSPKFWAIQPESLAANVIYAMNQPWGVNISDITVRATGEDMML